MSTPDFDERLSAHWLGETVVKEACSGNSEKRLLYRLVFAPAISHWLSCCADGRASGQVTTKISRMHG